MIEARKKIYKSEKAKHEELKAAVLELYAEGKSIKIIAGRLQCSEAVIINILKDFGDKKW